MPDPQADALVCDCRRCPTCLVADYGAWLEGEVRALAALADPTWFQLRRLERRLCQLNSFTRSVQRDGVGARIDARNHRTEVRGWRRRQVH